MYGKLSLGASQCGDSGYVQTASSGPVTYEGVTSVQRRASGAMQPFGGVCESWGVMH